MDMYIYITTERLFGYKLGRTQHDDEGLEEMTDGDFYSKYGHTFIPRLEDENSEDKK